MGLDYEKENRMRKTMENNWSMDLEERERNKTKDRRFPYGQYKGKLIRTIIRKDIQYINYCLEEGLIADVVEDVVRKFGLHKIRMPFGKLKGQLIVSAYITNRGLIKYWQENEIGKGLLELFEKEFQEIDETIFDKGDTM